MSRLVAFWSPGGSGATTLLLNTAAALGARRMSIAAVDLNLIRPSLALYADLLPHDMPQSACLSKLLPALDGGRLTVDEVTRRLLTASRFVMLPGMLDVVAGTRLTEQHVEQLLQVMRSRFDLVLVDVTPHLDSAACLPVLEMADRICLVAGPQIASRLHTRRHLLPLRGTGWEEKLSLVSNRAGAIPTAQMAHDCGLPVAAVIPELKAMESLLEAGRIAYEAQAVLAPLARFQRAVDQLATLVARGGET
jgi:Flp pilus assembly CpaE family ATPase